jgi:acid phosphatase
MKSIVYILVLFCLISCVRKTDEIVTQFDPHFKNVIPIVSEDTTTTFIVIGDWGYEGDGLQAVSEQMNELASYIQIDFIATLGDNFYPEGVLSTTDPNWDIFTDNFAQDALQIPWYISIGNHDHLGNEQAQVDYSAIDDRWTFPYFFYEFKRSINYSGDSLGVIVIDSQRLRSNPNSLNQLNWIDSVADASNTPWKIMMGHHPLYSYGYHGSSELMQGLLEETLNDNKIDLYLAGHDHDLQHIKTNGYTEYFISGSAGKIRDTDTGEYSLFSLSDYGFLTIRLSSKTLTCYFIDKEGKVVYSYKIVKQ